MIQGIFLDEAILGCLGDASVPGTVDGGVLYAQRSPRRGPKFGWQQVATQGHVESVRTISSKSTWESNLPGSLLPFGT